MYAKPWIAFWFFAGCCLLYFGYSLYRKWRGWSRGMKRNIPRIRVNGTLLRIWISEVFLQRQLFSLSAARWTIHQCIFWGFSGLICLSALKVAGNFLNVISPGSGLHAFLSSGEGYPLTKIWGNFFGLLLLGGCAGALGRRLFMRPSQLVPEQTDFLLTAYLLFLVVSGFMLEGFRLAAVSSDLARYSFIGNLFQPDRFGMHSGAGIWLTVTWVIHGFSGAALFVYLPHSKLMHSLLAPLVIALNASEEQGRKDMYWPKIKQYRQTK